MDKDKAASPDEQPDEHPNEGLFPVTDDVIEYLTTRGGMSRPDAIHGAFRVFRPGGPLDDVEYLTKCCSCGSEKAQTLRWFGDHEFMCECGGEFDVGPIHAFNEAVCNRDKGEAERILREFFRPIEHVH